jgi:PTS system nitrogen regulatory IIA component
VNLLDVVRPECIVTRARPADKSAALREVARAAKRSAILADVSEEEILRGLADREALGSTGFGKGLAIPHCRLSTVPDFVVGIITVPDGVGFESMDGKPVTLLIFIVAPERKSAEHIRLLSAISRILRTPGVIDEILSCTTARAVADSFLRHAREEPPVFEDKGRSLLQVFVQDEDVFREILQALAEIPACSVALVEAQSAAAYLAKLPLFAGFWTDAPASFSRIVLAVLDRRLVNETVRRIETITGSPSGREGVLITVQELFYSAGALAT